MRQMICSKNSALCISDTYMVEQLYMGSDRNSVLQDALNGMEAECDELNRLTVYSLSGIERATW